MRQLLTKAEKAGCTVELRRAGHWKVTTPGGQAVFCAASPSDSHALKNTKAELRRRGVDLR
jgi:hypothetical protein